MSKKRIAVVVHEIDLPLQRSHYFILLLIPEWERLGYDVRLVPGTSRFVPADVAIAHIDLTKTPREYLEFLSRYPVVVNRGLVDISKSRVSDQVLRDGDVWDGPVIVKTDLNCRGRRERDLEKRSTPLPRKILRLAIQRMTRKDRSPRLPEYQIFPSLEKVPAELRADARFVIERLVPEEADGGFVLRKLLRLGSRSVCIRSVAHDPIVKSTNQFRSDVVDCSTSVIDAANVRGMDYGKLDYVMKDGAPIVFDVNRTPSCGTPTPSELHLEQARFLAPGIADYFG